MVANIGPDIMGFCCIKDAVLISRTAVCVTGYSARTSSEYGRGRYF